MKSPKFDDQDDLSLGMTIRGRSLGQWVFGRYELKEEIGRGGMGVVWRAWDSKLELDVALKFLPQEMINDSVAIDELKRETRRSLQLTHSNIVRIYDLVEDERTSAISMEYIDGKTLSALLEGKGGGCFTVEELGPWVAQLCEALDYAHTKARIVHRDLKPANLMVDSKGELKITDFGIAGSVADCATKVKEAATGGTLLYMSPQQHKGMPAQAPDDIYALGATLYELLTGRPPFFTGNVTQQLLKVPPVSVNARRRELAMSGADVPLIGEETIAACLEKDSVKRPQNAKEVSQRLCLPAHEHSKNLHAAGKFPFGNELPLPKAGWLGRQAQHRLLILTGSILSLLLLLGVFLHTNKENALFAKASAERTELVGMPEGSEVLGSNLKREAYVNSLGMQFLPVPGTKVLFSIWETRVQDFAQFVIETGYDATNSMHSLGSGSDGWKQRGDTWITPGFVQGPTHPVVGVN